MIDGTKNYHPCIVRHAHRTRAHCPTMVSTFKLLLRQSAYPEDENFEISFLERSRKIKNGFVFPEMEDLASIGKKDIEKILPPPHAAAQTKRLCGVMKFNVDLSYV